MRDNIASLCLCNLQDNPITVKIMGTKQGEICIEDLVLPPHSIRWSAYWETGKDKILHVKTAVSQRTFAPFCTTEVITFRGQQAEVEGIRVLTRSIIDDFPEASREQTAVLCLHNETNHTTKFIVQGMRGKEMETAVYTVQPSRYTCSTGWIAKNDKILLLYTNGLSVALAPFQAMSHLILY